MQRINRENTGLKTTLPIKVIQFGEGNFLRAFVEQAFQKLNQEVDFNAGIAVVQPIETGMVAKLNEQDGLYTLFTKGIKNGREVEEKELITNVVAAINPYTDYNNFMALAREEDLEFVVSNTTEAGIAFVATDTLEMTPPTSFPGKLTAFLFKRYSHFNGDREQGLTIIPCELINYNADTLRQIIIDYIKLWKLPEDFKEWIKAACSFHNTLVDRIVPGYPKDQIAQYNSQLDYEDQLIVSAESFFLWVIEGDDQLKKKLPFHKANLDVKIVDNMQPFRTRKVRILNGAHTAMVPFSLLYGNTTVKETMDNNFTGAFIRSLVVDEVIPTLDMEQEELLVFAAAVFDRFKNPFIVHQLSSIALNSISKFKVRVLPSLLTYIEEGRGLPIHLVYAFACLIRFYKGSWEGEVLPVNDNKAIVNNLSVIWESESYKVIIDKVLQNREYWGEDLTETPQLKEAIASALAHIEKDGIAPGFSKFRKEFSTSH
ncbi:tagaturonate reductase [Muriicola sp. Z0-33]|uniref:tagaturonate reductase n=1 Tax=Muriicola sp. Z0-33 TaxID=2816957 RepID=UPI002238627F|nr:tagaturonate reductase [Muriicola sp. Z0-33]MCW5515681.1 tagaturonate reductase [Muriicola sp. Z0-33]